MQAVNPATESILAEYAETTEAEVEQKLAAALDAFALWRTIAMRDRSALMKNVAAILGRRRDELAALMTQEVGKTISASESEVDKCALACTFFAQNAARFLADQVIASDGSESFVRFEPLGPVLAIMPWNFPFWQVIRFAAPALMAGNVAVLKHAPNVPGCALALERIFAEAGFPGGVFTTLLIEDNRRAEMLPAHPAIRAVTLTGSERAGSAVAAAAGKALKKTVMELGGSDPFIVLADTDVESAARHAAESRCINNGQSCIAAKRFIVEKSAADRFESAMMIEMAAMKMGDPMHRDTRIGPLARLDLLEGLHCQVEATVKQGAILRMGGKRRAGRGFFYEPTVLSGVVPGMAAFDEETFGPVAAIVRADDAEHAVALANRTRYGLGASIWSRDVEHALSLARAVDAGNVFINGMVKSDPRLPFGGIKNSGWGRELAEFGIREFVNIKTVWTA